MGKRARPDIDTGVSYLCTRITKSKNHDWWKLKYLLKWLKQKNKDKQIMGISTNGIIETWKGAFYAGHDDIHRKLEELLL